jgi:Mg2+ and Co2+ transporter CorA
MAETEILTQIDSDLEEIQDRIKKMKLTSTQTVNRIQKLRNSIKEVV